MRRASPRGFTMIEMLIILGITLTLVATLLPVAGAAREASRSTNCLSNLRALGVINNIYMADNDRFVIPCDYGNPTTTANGHTVDETWATIIVTKGYLPDYPKTNPQEIPPEGTILQCPAGVLDFLTTSSITNQLPPSRTSGIGAMGVQHTSKVFKPGRVVYSWYGINGTSSGKSHPYIPCRRWPDDGGKTARLAKLSEIPRPAELVFMFDGMAINYYGVNANRINSRHNRYRDTNIVFFDGHAEKFAAVDLPGGAGNAGIGAGASETFSLENLKKYPFPRWRMDQY